MCRVSIPHINFLIQPMRLSQFSQWALVYTTEMNPVDVLLLAYVGIAYSGLLACNRHEVP